MRGSVFVLIFVSNLLQAQKLNVNYRNTSFLDFTENNSSFKIKFNFKDKSRLSLDDEKDLLKNRKIKKRKKLAAIFCGIANAFASIAQIINGNPKEGTTNLVGNIFNTAAQVTQIDANHAKNPEETEYRSFLLFNPMLDLTEVLYTINSEEDSPELDMNKFPNIKELTLLVTYSQRAGWLAKKIIENYFVQSFLKEALDYIEIYLHNQVDRTLDFLRSNLLINYGI